MARGLKFQIKVEEGFYSPYIENKGADQLRGHREAGLRICFCICKKPVFSQRGSFVVLCKQCRKGFTDVAEQPQISHISLLLFLKAEKCIDRQLSGLINDIMKK